MQRHSVASRVCEQCKVPHTLANKRLGHSDLPACGLNAAWNYTNFVPAIEMIVDP